MFFSKKPDYQQMFMKYLDKDFMVFTDPQNPPSQSDVKNFETKYSTTLPRDFKDFSTPTLSGAYIEVKEAIWPRPKIYEVGAFWSFLYAICIYSFSKESPEWMNIEKQAQEFTTNVNPNYIPFLKIIGSADVYCFDKSGSIFQWDHETNVFNKIDKTFNQVLEYEIAELKRRKEQKKAGKQ